MLNILASERDYGECEMVDMVNLEFNNHYQWVAFEMGGGFGHINYGILDSTLP